jgi:hypothetical protein
MRLATHEHRGKCHPCRTSSTYICRLPKYLRRYVPKYSDQPATAEIERSPQLDGLIERQLSAEMIDKIEGVGWPIVSAGLLQEPAFDDAFASTQLCEVPDPEEAARKKTKIGTFGNSSTDLHHLPRSPRASKHPLQP